MADDVTEWGRPVAIVRQDPNGRWRVHKPRGNPFREVPATYPNWEAAAELGMLLYGDVVVIPATR